MNDGVAYEEEFVGEVIWHSFFVFSFNSFLKNICNVCILQTMWYYVIHFHSNEKYTYLETQCYGFIFLLWLCSQTQMHCH